MLKDRFMELVRVFMKVAKDTVMTASLSIKGSKTMRRLELGEVVEVLEGPVKETTVDVQRVFARVMKDNLEGWITLAGNQGSVFLEDGGKVFRVEKDVALEDNFEPDSNASKKADARVLKVGDLVEVLEWPQTEPKSSHTRMKCKCKSDGATGWVTSVSKTGMVYLEVV